MKITRKTRRYSYATCHACGSYCAAVSLRATWPNGEVQPELVLCHVCARAIARRVPLTNGARR